MALKVYRPTTPGRRGTSVVVNVLSRKQPEKSLLLNRAAKAGRNAQGKITVRHRGGGDPRAYRLVDFLRNKLNVPGLVAALEYDPNRSANLALVHYTDGEKRYILAPDGLKVGDTVVSSREKIDVKPGNVLPLQYIPTGIMVHNIELTPGRGGSLVRSAGVAAMVMAIEDQFVLLKLPSGEIRRFDKNCAATVGQVGNIDWGNVRWGKAGRMRRRGIRPTVRGKAMNPVDHPHGGGEGHNPIGMVHPKTKWGRPAEGVKTRNPNKPSSQFIVKRRK